jgi:protein-S-isoprenylcysteine O-methyltransferase Ste14
VSVLDFTGAFLATFFVLVAILYTARMRGWTQRTHAEAQFFGPIGSLQFMARVMFEGFRWLIFLACVGRVWLSEIDDWAGSWRGLWRGEILLTGVGLMLLGLYVVTHAQAFLGEHWRSGVPREGPIGFVREGPYASLRHPIFLGVHLGQIGLFLAWPSAFTATSLVVGFVAVQVQARVEERRMAAAFGDDYLRYRRATPGFIPMPRRKSNNKSQPA